MARKNLLAEGTVRQWGKLANIAPLADRYIKENAEQFNEADDALEEEKVEEGGGPLEEDNSAGGVGPNREGAGKDGEHKGIAKDQGKDPKSTPDGKLTIPGTGYAGDHKFTKMTPTKGTIDSGTQLQGKGTVSEGLDDMPPADDMGTPPMDAAPAPAAGGMDLEGLVAAIARAITDSTGVEVSVAGAADVGADMGAPAMDAAPPVDDMAPPGDAGGDLPAEMDLEPAGDMGGEEELDDMEEKKNFALQQEAMVESIAKKVVEKLSAKAKTATKPVAKTAKK